MPPTAKKEYYYGLDQLRAVLMLIGVVFHASLLVSPVHTWNYNSHLYKSEWISAPMYLTHFLRMETFFLIAGFFSCMVIMKKGREYFLNGRYRRVLIPLISCILLINTFELWFSLKYQLISRNDIGIGDFIAHAWFLLTLMMLSLICLLPVEKWLDGLANLPLAVKIAAFLCYLFLPFAAKFALSKVIAVENHELFYAIYGYLVEKTLYYSVYFFLGYALYRSRYLRDLLENQKVFYVMLVIAVAGLIAESQVDGNTAENFSIARRSAMLLLTHATSLASAWVLFKLFFHGEFKPSRLSGFLVRSAIIIYLFHHPLVIMFGYFFDVPGLTAAGYFLAVSAVTYALSFAAYVLINRFAFTRMLFGIK